MIEIEMEFIPQALPQDRYKPKLINRTTIGIVDSIVSLIQTFLKNDKHNRRFKLSFISYYNLQYDDQIGNNYDDNIHRRKKAILGLMVDRLTKYEIPRIDIFHTEITIKNPKTRVYSNTTNDKFSSIINTSTKDNNDNIRRFAGLISKTLN